MNRNIIGLTLLAASGFAASAQTMPVRVGVRAGINTSNIAETRTGADAVTGLQKSAWKTGLQAGAVVDIPMTSFLAIQPGFFFDLRRSSYTTMSEHHYVPAPGDPEATMARRTSGTVTTGWFHVPVLFSFRYSPHSKLQLQADFGPYLSAGIGGRDSYTVTDFSGDIPATVESPRIKQNCFGKGDARYFRADWGFKMGIGVEICRHYYIGAHYLAGARNIARNKAVVSKSDTREWQFSLGYNF